MVPLLFAILAHTSTSPEQVQLSHGVDPSTISVSWLSNTAESSVYYGQAKSDLKEVTGAPGEKYSFISKYKPEFNYTSEFIHHVQLSQLESNTRYFYKVGSSGQVTSFLTPPAVSRDAKLVFAIMGDLGQTNNSNATIHQVISSINTRNVVSAMIVGDMSYADSAWQPESWNFYDCNQTRWDRWGRLIEPLASQIPLMVCPGNHEVEQEGDLPATQTEFLAYDKRFAMPAKESGATEGNQYFSYELGSVHVIMMNSYADYNETSLQYKWFTEDLAKVDRSKTPWIVVGMHAPFYNSNRKHHDEAEEVGMRQVYEDQLLFAEVDVIFSGHVHAYERMHNVKHNKTDLIDGLLYINIGDGGNREGHAGPYLQMPEWSAFREDQFGHGILTVANATHMEWEWHRCNNSAPVGDSVTIIKKHAIGISKEGAVAVPRGRDAHEYLYTKDRVDGLEYRKHQAHVQAK